MKWVERIAPTLDELIPELGSDNVIFSLDVSEIAEHEDWTAERIKGIPTVASIPMEVMGRVVSLRLPMAFVAMGHSPKNEAERLLVNAFVNGALVVAGLGGSHERATEVLLALALSDDDRFMHLFVTRDARQYLQEFDHEAPELLHDDEVAFSAIHIAQEANLCSFKDRYC